VGRVIPSVADQTQWPYAVLGVGFAILGIAFIVYGLRRQQAVQEALNRGEYALPHGGTLKLLTGYGVVLALALLVLVAVKT
jgi:uncharacterized membrane protein YidH (DUF202 family)